MFGANIRGSESHIENLSWPPPQPSKKKIENQERAEFYPISFYFP